MTLDLQIKLLWWLCFSFRTVLQNVWSAYSCVLWVYQIDTAQDVVKCVGFFLSLSCTAAKSVKINSC